ncbi:MAG: hypothetical protein WDO19_02130 [Bacteroidota bacterium]
MHGEGFILTDEDGNQYYFNAAETSISSFSTSDAPTTEKTAWYLTQIVDALGKDAITFQYESHAYSLPTMFVSQTKKRLSSAPPPTPPGGEQLPHLIDQTTEIDQFIDGVLLKSITAGNWTVNFNYSFRNDIGDKKLDLITLSVDNAVTKSFAFSYSASGEKLILESLSEYPQGGGDPLQHTFEYYLKNEIPAIDSKAQDHWGYYNGADGNSSMIPTFTTYQGIQTGGNREPDEERSMVGILTKIIYPTGGSTSFEYESNDFARVNGRDIPDLQTKIVNHTAVASAKYTTGPAEDNATFSISYPQWVTIHYTISNCDPNILGVCQSPSHEPSGGILQLSRSSGDYIVDINGGIPDQVNNQTYQVSLNAGTYHLYCSAPGLYDNCLISVKYEDKEIDNTIKSIAGGGLRIKKITHFDGINAQNNRVLTYEYKRTDGSDESSGIIANLPKYDYSYTQLAQTDNNGNPGCGQPYHYIVYSSNSTHPLGTTNGSYVGYETITEKYEGNNSSYKVVNYFTTADIYPDAISVQPFLPPTSFDWRRGLLKRKDYFDAADNLVRQETKEYLPDDSSRTEIVNLKIGQNTTCLASSLLTDGTYFPESYYTGYYKHISEWFKLTSETLVEFDNNSNNSVTNMKQYEYDPVTLQQNKITTTDSKGYTSIVTITYPQGYAVTGNPTNKTILGIKALQDKHILSKQIETVSTKIVSGVGTLVTGAILTSYDPSTLEAETVFNVLNKGGISGFTNFSIDQNSIVKDPHYFPRLSFIYNDNRKLIEAGKADDYRTVYLWGYNSCYPVAKVVGSDYNTVKNLITQTVLDNPATSDHDMRDELNNIRTGLLNTKALVTTYTYKPLIGITSETDPNGKTTYYEYDIFGRLKLIRDQDNNIIKTFDYKYQQNTN